MPNRDGALAPITTQIERAEALLAEREMRSAIATAQAASETAQQLAKALADYREIRSAIVQGRKDAEALVADGYRMDASHAALDQAREALAAAAAAIQRGELPSGPSILPGVVWPRPMTTGRGWCNCAKRIPDVSPYLKGAANKSPH